jgi:pimeloyl-ACP methyl ester carboxylesterase
MKKLWLITIYCLLAGIGFAQQTQESEIILKTPTGDISGTLTLPAGVKNAPVVLIIAGSGPTDRDCNSNVGLKTNAYKYLAQELEKQGIACVRFDKRGIAQSREAIKYEDELRFETYVNDVVQWIAYLKNDLRFNRIVVAGHSEGSLTGILAARQATISGLISISGVACRMDQILKEQLKSKLPTSLFVESGKILDSLSAGKTVKYISPELNSLFRLSVQPYIISWMKYNPSEEIRKLTIPVLIIQGTTDLQVSADNAKLLKAAKPDAELKIFENMNHILKEAVADPQLNFATYTNSDLPLKSGLVDEIAQFVKRIK